MTSNEPQIPPVKQVSANPVQTQEGFEEPGYIELSDPDNFFFDPDWYLICDIPDEDPWFSIVDDFINAKFFAERLLKAKQIKPLKAVYTAQYHSKAKKDVVAVSGDELLYFLDVVEQMLRRKTVDPDFLSVWGKMQRAYARLEIAHPDLVERQRIGINGQSRNREKQKQWYALWWKLYQHLTRKKLNEYLEKLCSALYQEAIEPPKGWTKESLRNFVSEMAGEQRGQFKLSTGLTEYSNFGKAALVRYAELGDKNPNLPPVGEASYKPFSKL